MKFFLNILAFPDSVAVCKVYMHLTYLAKILYIDANKPLCEVL